MSVEAGSLCTLCGKIMSNKSNLIKHVRCVHRRSNMSNDVEDLTEFECFAEQCSFKTMYQADLKKHTQKCIFVLVNNAIHNEQEKNRIAIEQQLTTIRKQHSSEIATIKAQYVHELNELHRALSNVETENRLLKHELEKAQQSAHSLAKDAINRPTTTTNNHQQIGNVGNVKITNYLTDHNTYSTQTHPTYVKHMLDQHFETYFMDGQPGLARFLVEHIIKMSDGKLILVCTDTARKRFRFLNADGKMAEDMKAKMLCSKLSVPIREMCNEVFDRVIARLESDKKVKISNGCGAFEIDFLDKKIEWAGKKFIEIRSFNSGGDDNTDFLNELATLLRNPCEDDDDIQNIQNI